MCEFTRYMVDTLKNKENPLKKSGTKDLGNESMENLADSFYIFAWMVADPVGQILRGETFGDL